MIDYNLAKKLKDAGFPQKGLAGQPYIVPEGYLPHPDWCIRQGQAGAHCCKECLCLHDDTRLWNCLTNLTCDCHRWPMGFPTLSELISECGESFSCLERIGKSYLATGERTSEPYKVENLSLNPPYRNLAISVVSVSGKGSTPEIAVANLWLAIHKK